MQILELQLASSSLSQQFDFYTGVLGFSTVRTTSDTVVLQAGSSRLTFTLAEEPAASRYHFAFNIPEHQFAAASQWLRSRVDLLADSSGRDEFYSADWNSHGVYFFDPGGNVVEYIARHSLSSPDQGSFSPRSVLGLSEIGIAAEDVAVQVDVISARSGAAVFHDSAGPTFTAVGDDHGLFIVVRRGRIWFPETGVTAEHLPLTIITGTQADPMRWQFA